MGVFRGRASSWEPFDLFGIRVNALVREVNTRALAIPVQAEITLVPISGPG